MKICKIAGCDKPATRKGCYNSHSRKQYYAEHQDKHQQEELINRLLLENQNLRIENTILKAAQ